MTWKWPFLSKWGVLWKKPFERDVEKILQGNLKLLFSLVRSILQQNRFFDPVESNEMRKRNKKGDYEGLKVKTKGGKGTHKHERK